MTRITASPQRLATWALAALALASVAVPAAAQPRQNEHWDNRGNQNRHPGWDNGYYGHPPGWSNKGYYARPPVVYGSPYRYGYGYPPPVIYNPGIGIYLPGLTLGIH